MNMNPQQQKQLTWPTIEEQKAYWEAKDIGGNVLPDRVEANQSQYGEQCVYCGKNSWECEHHEEANRDDI